MKSVVYHPTQELTNLYKHILETYQNDLFLFSTQTNTVIDFTINSIDLRNGEWHLIIVSIANLQAACYIDGALIAER